MGDRIVMREKTANEIVQELGDVLAFYRSQAHAGEPLYQSPRTPGFVPGLETLVARAREGKATREDARRLGAAIRDFLTALPLPPGGAPPATGSPPQRP